MERGRFGFVASLSALLTGAQPGCHGGDRGTPWVVSWAASIQGPYPAGNASAQPDLTTVFSDPKRGARNQSFRLIVKPEIWGCHARLRLSNVFGNKAVTFAGVHVGLQQAGSAVTAGTNRPVAFAGSSSVTVAPGASAWSDPVALPWACGAAAGPMAGRKLAVSFHIPGESGPMTWHAKALQTSYLTGPEAGLRSGEEHETAFPFSTTSWYFLDALEMRAPAGSRAVVAFGDSITDGTNSTLNGDDRWPDVLARRLRAAYGNRVSVVNAGIGGNQILGPVEYSPENPFPGGPSALARLERDVLSLSGVAAVIWLEGINDLGLQTNASVEALKAGFTAGAARLRETIPGVRVIGATLTSAVGAAGNSGHPEQDQKRRALNDFIRNSGGVFDAVADFDRATFDAASGQLRREFIHNTTVGGRGDYIHPNRLGYAAMGKAVDIQSLALDVSRSSDRTRSASTGGTQPVRPPATAGKTAP